MNQKKYGLHSFPDGIFFEGFQENEDFHIQKYIGGLLIYVHGKRMVWLCNKPGIKRWRKKTFKKDIWDGCLVASRFECRTKLIGELPDSNVHPVIRDSIYLARTSENFEEAMFKLVQLIERRSPLVGVESDWMDK